MIRLIAKQEEIEELRKNIQIIYIMKSAQIGKLTMKTYTLLL